MEIQRPPSQHPLPPHAKRVFKGEIFEVFQWEQEMFDGSTAIFEKVKRPDTVVVFAVLPDGRIILTKQEQPGKKPFIGGTGGIVDPDEDILDAAKRELLEESGYRAEGFTLWHADQPIAKIEWAIYVFVAKGLQKITEIKPDAGERIELYPVTFEEFLKVAAQEDFREQEIVPLLLEAKLDQKKMTELRELFSPTVEPVV